MRFLLIHQNFPGQFRQLVPYLSQKGHEVVGICSHDRPLPPLAGVQVLRYREPKASAEGLSSSSQLWDNALSRAEAVAGLCAQLDAQGWRPNCIAAHSGWGESLALNTIWPQVPQILWPELWIRSEQMGLKPTGGSSVGKANDDIAHLGRNLLTRAGLSMASAWVLPTQHQANSLPHCFQNAQLHVIHEGIDAKTTATPDPSVHFEVRGMRIDRNVPTLTLVNRQLESLRGFDTFMRALPALQQRHNSLRVLIVGDNEPGYGPVHASGRPLREVMLQELQGQLDLDRIHFLGRIPHPHLIKLLQVSSVHVYLSAPFILGWSLLEAMACGCCVVGSEGAPVNEVIEHNVDGLLVPRTDPMALANAVDHLLRHPKDRAQLGQAARQRALLYDQRLTLPQLTELLERHGRRQHSP